VEAVSDKNLERRVEEWVKVALCVDVEPSPEEPEKSWDLMDGEYAGRKLGLPSRKEVRKP
jgi:hypothetical protein